MPWKVADEVLIGLHSDAVFMIACILQRSSKQRMTFVRVELEANLTFSSFQVVYGGVCIQAKDEVQVLMGTDGGPVEVRVGIRSIGHAILVAQRYQATLRLREILGYEG